MDERRLGAVVCDDDAIACQVITMLAPECGFEVVAQTAMAHEAEAAVRVAQAHVLVLDLSLFGPPGHEIVPELLRNSPSCKVIVNTAFDTLGAGRRNMASSR